MWDVKTTDRFDQWFDALSDIDRENVLASLLLLQERGLLLSRPYADVIHGSKYVNMKELRVQSRGKPLRAFFVFDPKRQAIVLCAGDKSKNSKRFYQEMLSIAEQEFGRHLSSLVLESL